MPALFALGARGYASALVLRTLMRLGLAGTYMPGVRLVASTFPADRRGAALGIIIACFSVGAATSLLLAGWLLPAGSAHDAPADQPRPTGGRGCPRMAARA